MSTSAPLKTAVVICRLTPAERANLDRKTAEIARRTGRPVTLSQALREGAANYLDELLADDGEAIA